MVLGRTLRSTFKTTPTPISSPFMPISPSTPNLILSPISFTRSVPLATNISPSPSIAVAAPSAILGKPFKPNIVFTDLGRHKITNKPDAFGNLSNYSNHLKGFTKKASDKCKEVVFDGINGFRSVFHLDLDSPKVEKRDATQIDKLVNLMTRLERDSYWLCSAQDLDLVWISEALLSLNIANFPKMAESPWE